MIHMVRKDSVRRRRERSSVLTHFFILAELLQGNCGAARPALLQLGVFGLGFFQDADVGVGVFPESEEILIRRLGFGGVAG